MKKQKAAAGLALAALGAVAGAWRARKKFSGGRRDNARAEQGAGRQPRAGKPSLFRPVDYQQEDY